MGAKRKKQLNLVLYSGGQSRSNHRLHREVLRLALKNRKNQNPSKRASGDHPITLTYIPYMDEGAEPFFARAMRRYRAAGIHRFFTLDPTRKPHRSEIQILLESDVIYLAGGNTYTFLHHLKRSGLFQILKQYAEQGGVLAGLSAGAILMTPTIALAGIPTYDVDENEVGLKNPSELQALGLVDFEFSPHDTHDPRRKRELQHHALTAERPIFSIEDGSGIVVEDNRILLIGRGKLYLGNATWRFAPPPHNPRALARKLW